MTASKGTGAAGPLVLIVRDGWGRNPNAAHDDFNAVRLAATPVCDALLRDHPWTLIHTSGEDVGLPEGTMGNSEVGHQNLGAGRIVDQESVRITKAIRDGTFARNPALVEAVDRQRARNRPVHLLGIASDAGVHGLMSHLYACLELCRARRCEAALHLLTDGRDTGPFTGIDFVRRIEARCAEVGVGRIASICGRYWAMDRDNRWQRVARAYDLLTGRAPEAPAFDSATDAVQRYYDKPDNPSQTGDEFITPRYVGAWRDTRIADGDSVVFYNYRGDRPRELIYAFVHARFHGHAAPSPDDGERGFDRGPRLDLHFTTMTAYEEALNELVHVAFPKQPRMTDIGADYLARCGLRQFRTAETEKFPHVTFFFNDYREEPFPGESRGMAQSPKVPTYDLQPQMSAEAVTTIALDRLGANDCEDFILINYANGDMVGHTGKLEAAVKAIETVDRSVGRIVDATLARGGRLIVSADHGNAEQMFDPETGSPHTAHTTYDVECMLVDPTLARAASGTAERPSTALRRDGRLADVFPTALRMLGLEQPEAMSGAALLP